MAANDADGQQVHATVTSLDNNESDEEPLAGERTGPAGAADDEDYAGADGEEDFDEGYADDPDAMIIDDTAAPGSAEPAGGAMAEPRQAGGQTREAAGPGMASGDQMPGDQMPGDQMPGDQVSGDTQQLHDQWAAIQSTFVDDPRGSVAAAAELVSGAIRAMIATAQEREQGLRAEWDRAGTDTEALRNALRGYRNLLDQVVVQ